MKKLCSKGCKISQADRKALDHYLLVTPLKWAQDSLKGMINKAIKTILREGFEAYKDTIQGNVSSDLSIIIPGILALPGFKLTKIPTPEMVQVKRTEPKGQEIWPAGFDVQDYEDAALRALYEDPEAMLDWFMENKIYQRRKAFCKEKETECIKNNEAFPANQDDFINFIHAKPTYKNRQQSEGVV